MCRKKAAILILSLWTVKKTPRPSNFNLESATPIKFNLRLRRCQEYGNLYTLLLCNDHFLISSTPCMQANSCYGDFPAAKRRLSGSHWSGGDTKARRANKVWVNGGYKILVGEILSLFVLAEWILFPPLKLHSWIAIWRISLVPLMTRERGTLLSLQVNPPHKHPPTHTHTYHTHTQISKVT